ncbi:hypothetical protein QYM36_006071, partial [Artemia franciscana]
AQSKKEAEKIVKNIIKIVVKVGFLAKNDQFGREELIVAENFRRKFHSLCMTVVSFHEVDFSYDRTFLLKATFYCDTTENTFCELVQIDAVGLNMWKYIAYVAYGGSLDSAVSKLFFTLHFPSKTQFETKSRKLLYKLKLKKNEEARGKPGLRGFAEQSWEDKFKNPTQ